MAKKKEKKKQSSLQISLKSKRGDKSPRISLQSKSGDREKKVLKDEFKAVSEPLMTKEDRREIKEFDEISIGLSSSETILGWSYGEVKKPETINYRTFKPEKDGLFCERIFGPSKDWECNCGKFKKIKYKGVVCDRCGVEVTESRVRRERMGHISLVSPVAHIWFFKISPSRIGTLLGISLRMLEKVIYFEEYIVLDPKDTPLKKKQLLNEEEYKRCKEEYKSAFKVGIGAEAILILLREIDLEKMSKDLHKELKGTTSQSRRHKIVKIIRIAEGFRNSGNKPEWMVLSYIPVIPPDLRPLVPLEGGRFATSDLNDLYRRVINRNNRLKKLLELRAPEIIIRNEKRMLQEAVDALFDNGRHGRPVLGPGGRPLKSLSEMLKGKQGRFRQNLLGKRVDYSGRSVIVIGPELKLHQCGLPKEMALELYEPFIIRRLREQGIVHTIKSAKKMVERVRPEVWDILEEVIKEHPVLLNRAPTLHRLGIQAFEPTLIEGKAIRIHPLVCTAFNADFDGDQMAVHIPLSLEAQMEARILMLSSNNIFSPSSGSPIVCPTQDIVLGCCYLTAEKKQKKGEGKIFSSPDEVLIAYSLGKVDLHARIKARINDKVIATTIGRIIFNDCLPAELRFINEIIDKKKLEKIVTLCFNKLGHHQTVLLLDRLKNLGFYWATLGGISIGIDDIRIPLAKGKILQLAQKEASSVDEQYRKGVITDGERYNKVIDIWTHATDMISEELFSELKNEETNRATFNSVFIMAESGARGSHQQIRQLGGIRGLMAKPSGEIIESPITSNFREGLSVLEYFISTHGARKGLADTALKTADSGYLTRRLVDVAQEVIITEEDCGTLNGILIGAIMEGDQPVVSLRERIIGRVALDNVVDIVTDKIIVKSGEEISEDKADEIEKVGIEKIRIRSVLTCESAFGVCAKCYGRDLAARKMVELGTSVGVIAAQSIGEPGTQLTMRTFHIGGTASRIVEQSKIIVRNDGQVQYFNLRTVKNKEGNIVVLNRNGEIAVLDEDRRELERYTLLPGAIIYFPDTSKIQKGKILSEWDPYTSPIISEVDGVVKYEDIYEGLTMHEEIDETTGIRGQVIIEHKEELHPQIVIVKKKNEALGKYPLPTGARISVKQNQRISAGEIIAKTPRQIMKTRDITGGLPRVAELFEARRPKNPAVITEIDGVVTFAAMEKGVRKVKIKGEVDEAEYIIPPGKHLIIYKDDRVVAGQQLTDGSLVLHDILRICGDKRLQEYLVNEVQEVYRLQGVFINDKHIEIIVRQMLRKVEIVDSGDSEFLIGEQVDKHRFNEVNEKLVSKKKNPARAIAKLLGITKASLSTESFIAAASFQETTRILSEAAAMGKVDGLRGLKENVIVGHLIPAGTGFLKNREIEVKTA